METSLQAVHARKPRDSLRYIKNSCSQLEKKIIIPRVEMKVY
jgi:hypothetical protein